MKIEKNITEFTYEKTSFEGYRVSRRFLGETFRKYYSVNEFGTFEKALEVSRERLVRLNEELMSCHVKGGKLSENTIKRANNALEGL